MDIEHLEPDLGTAAYLKVRGFRLLGLALLEGRRYGFRFADPDWLAAQAALDYLQGKAIAANSLVAAEKDLKTLLYSEKKRNLNGNGNYKYEALR